jgi:hypothetical protein
VKDEEAARVLLDHASRRSLRPFLGREASLTEAARETGLPLSTLAYRVRLYQRLGLLEHTRTEPRKGRPVRYYRAPESYFVPFSVTPLATTTSLSEAAFLELHRLLMDSIGAAWDEAAGARREIGLHVMRGPDDVTWNIEPLPDHSAPESFFRDLLLAEKPAVWNQLTTLRLKREAAKALQREIVELVGRYWSEQDAEGGEYILRLAMAPLLRRDT